MPHSIKNSTQMFLYEYDVCRFGKYSVWFGKGHKQPIEVNFISDNLFYWQVHKEMSLKRIYPRLLVEVNYR